MTTSLCTGRGPATAPIRLGCDAKAKAYADSVVELTHGAEACCRPKTASAATSFEVRVRVINARSTAHRGISNIGFSVCLTSARTPCRGR